MVQFLGPDEPEVRSAADWARGTLSRLGARPYLERLEAALARPDAAAGVAAGAEPAAEPVRERTPAG